MSGAFEPLIDLVKVLVARSAPNAVVREYPGLIEPAALKRIAAAPGRLSAIIGYGGQGNVDRLQAGDAVATLSFGVFFVAKGAGDVVQAGRQTAAAALAFASALAAFTPAAGLPPTADNADDAEAGVLGVTEADEIVVETDSTKELLAEHIIFNVVSWTHGLILGEPRPYPGGLPPETIAAVEMDGQDADGAAVTTLLPDEDA